MRITLVPIALAASLGFTGLALAAGTRTEGKILAIDMATHTITLEDGIVYSLPATFTDPGLKIGETVYVTWELKDNKHEASLVEKAM